ncbi:Rhodanese-like protein [Gigaspora margarita]|uniref:Rhodanese-like protein n=2 Tax=Gigaspora margarita TaxID=4874 RepID=A0A8H3X0H7_GIGMA|nr:Rhodanese-like protein [Gigaspora margarita]
MSKPSYIKAEELREIIKNKTKVPGKDYLVVDVRDEDYQGGNIPNVINKPSDNFTDSLDGLISEYSQVPKIIFTCRQSRVRGPSCAVAYASKVNTDQTIHVLKGGMDGWLRKYKDDSELVENYVEEEEWDF